MYAKEQKARNLSQRSSLSSSSSSPRSSADQAVRPSQPRKSISLKNAANKVIHAAKEHRKSVNSAFDAYYGTNYYSRPQETEGYVNLQ